MHDAERRQPLGPLIAVVFPNGMDFIMLQYLIHELILLCVVARNDFINTGYSMVNRRIYHADPSCQGFQGPTQEFSMECCN